LSSKGYEAADFRDGSVSARTLSALEYLLFSESEENACAANAEINAGGTWAALDAGELRSRRAAYAAKTAELVHAAADELVVAWEPAGGAFLESFATGGRRQHGLRHEPGHA
jgi:predicted lipoprotein